MHGMPHMYHLLNYNTLYSKVGKVVLQFKSSLLLKKKKEINTIVLQVPPLT